MGDDVITRLFDKIDDLSDRLARVETMLSEREKLQIEKEKSQNSHIGLIGWLVTTGIAVGALFKH